MGTQLCLRVLSVFARPRYGPPLYLSPDDPDTERYNRGYSELRKREDYKTGEKYYSPPEGRLPKEFNENKVGYL